MDKIQNEVDEVSIPPMTQKFDYQSLGYQPFSAYDKPLFDFYLNQLGKEVASYYSFIELIAWGELTKVYYRVIGDYLCLLLEEHPYDKWQVSIPFGSYEETHFEQWRAVMLTLEQDFQQNNLPFSCYGVKEWMLPWVERLQQERQWNCIHYREMSDYFYTVEDFRASLDKADARYRLRRLLKGGILEARPIAVEDRPLWQGVLQRTFCQHHDCAGCDQGCLKQVLDYLLFYPSELGARGFLVLYNGEPVGYAVVGDCLRGIIFLSLKYDYKIKGLEEWIRREVITRYCQGVEWVNYTEDMGLEGLRRHKQRLATYRLSHNFELEAIEA